VVEPKQRKVSMLEAGHSAGLHLTQASAVAASAVVVSDVDAGSKNHRTLRSMLRSPVKCLSFGSLSRCRHRRLVDCVYVTGVLSFEAFGYFVVQKEVLYPPDSPVSQVAYFLGHVILILHLASWVGLVYHGPGRPSPSPGCSQLPPDVSEALKVGKFCLDRAFGPDDGWCSACNAWKPTLANHCKVCQKCSMWMDHHCNFAGQCVGFRNLRCFIIWLFYGQLMLWLGVTFVLKRLLLGPVPAPLTLVGLIGYVIVSCAFMHFHRTFLKKVLGKVSAGWPSAVLEFKYDTIVCHAREMEKEAASGAQQGDEGTCAAWVPIFRKTIARVQQSGGGLRGLFAAQDFVGSLSFVFGEPPSWRWLLPMRAGGLGDPLRPTVHDSDACAAWGELNYVMESYVVAKRIAAQRRQKIQQLSAGDDGSSHEKLFETATATA